MIYCSKCGSGFNPELGACPACNREVPRVSETPIEVTAKRLAIVMEPLRDAAEHASAEASSATTSTTSKSRAPSGASVPHAHQPATTDSSSHEEIVSLLRSVGKKLVATQRLAKRHGKWVWGVSVTIIVILIGLLAQEWRDRWQHPQPDAIWIEVEGNADRWPEGKPLKLVARVSPPGNVPREFKWTPPDFIEGNGQQKVTLSISATDRRAEYPITVGLVAKDQLGYNCVAVENKTITIVPLPLWNQPPWFEENIHMEGSPEVRSGSSISLEALAKDKENDKLTYKWEVSSKLVEIVGSGRTVVLRFPKGFARRANVLVTVNLTVSDGHHSIPEDETLTITPEGSVRISRPKSKNLPPKLATPLTQPGPSKTPTVESPPSMAVPQSSPHHLEPGRS